MSKIITAAFFLIVILFFWKFFLHGLLPIPSDTIVGLYHPFRDLYATNFPNGIPFKNFLITDPVRQTYVWKEITIALLNSGQLPLWNPYSFSGTPLLASLQPGAFYPLNLLFVIAPFAFSWSIFIFLQPLLAGLFLYFYLINLKLNKFASFLGAFVFSFSGFFISWLQWGTILHTALWLPLILLSIDKILNFKTPTKDEARQGRQNSKLQLKSKNLLWLFIFIFSLASSFFAGHLQTFFYLLIVSMVYFIVRWVQFGRKKNFLSLFIILNSLFLILTSIQWIPTLKFIMLSGRSLDQNWQNIEGWFIPWQNLIQFVAPDFFGNPATLNYWGIWNYAEFVGYIGILPLIFSLFALFMRRDKKTLFFGSLFFISLIFSLPTIFAKLPYMLNIPFVSTSQPTRLIFITDFSLSILAALGIDYFLKNKEKKSIFYSIIFMAIVFSLPWLFILFGNKLDIVSLQDLAVSRRNLILPTGIFAFSSILIFIAVLIKGYKKFYYVIFGAMLVLVVFDLFRFGWKFTPFTNKEFLFPQTKAIEFIKSQEGEFRIASSDLRVFPPNFSVYYRIQSIEGYDPLYLRRYAELISASERGKPDISPPFGFNRIITPHNLDSKIIDLLGVKFILSLSDISSEKLVKVFQEGNTRVYENLEALPRAFFVSSVKPVKSKEEALEVLFSDDFTATQTAVVEEVLKFNDEIFQGNAKITEYSETKVIVQTENNGNGFLVLTDTFYPSWKAKIDGRETRIIRTNYNFRGVFVPAGEHTIVFYNTLF